MMDDPSDKLRAELAHIEDICSRWAEIHRQTATERDQLKAKVVQLQQENELLWDVLAERTKAIEALNEKWRRACGERDVTDLAYRSLLGTLEGTDANVDAVSSAWWDGPAGFLALAGGLKPDVVDLDRLWKEAALRVLAMLRRRGAP